jgi:hypothetical protein
VKSPRRLAVLAALCGTVVLAAGLVGLGSPGIKSAGAPIEVSRATSATAGAEHVDAPQATALGGDGVSVADTGSGSAALSDPRPMPRPTTPPAPIASVSTPDPVRNEARRQLARSKSPTWRAAALLCPTVIRCRDPQR